MAATNLENQLHSAQKNLLFLQREHASTLKGLHAEIRRLQQHCTGEDRLMATEAEPLPMLICARMSSFVAHTPASLNHTTSLRH